MDKAYFCHLLIKLAASKPPAIADSLILEVYWEDLGQTEYIGEALILARKTVFRGYGLPSVAELLDMALMLKKRASAAATAKRLLARFEEEEKLARFEDEEKLARFEDEEKQVDDRTASTKSLSLQPQN